MRRKGSKLPLPFFPGPLGIKIAKSLNDDIWAAYGDRLIRSPQQELPLSERLSFEIDLSECQWADPTPIMSILLHGNHLIHKGVSVTLRLCHPEDITSDNKFPVFFVKHGFATAACDAGMNVVDANNNAVSMSEQQRYLEREDVLVYPDPPVIRVRLVNFDSSYTLRARDLVSKVVSELTDQAREAYEYLVHRSVFTGLLYRTQVVLEETIQNVIDHAYISSEYTPALSVFARFRRGLKRLDSIDAVIWRKTIERENANCPFMNSAFLEDKEGCIEIFVVDHGIGIASSFGKSGKTLEGRKVIRSLLQRVFTVGESTKQKKRADAGGLTVIYNQMIPNRDYLRGYDCGTWFGVAGRLHRPTQKIEEQAVEKGDTMPIGLAWTIRLGLRGDIQPVLPWKHPDEQCRARILDEFTRYTLTNPGPAPARIIDSRIKAVVIYRLPMLKVGAVVTNGASFAVS